MKNYTFILLIIVFLAQLIFPFKMIFESEQILSSGKEYKFLIEPVDPNDPFRGKYITLRYFADEFYPEEKNTWEQKSDIYVHLTTDSAGFAKILKITSSRPENNVDYVKAKIDYYYSESNMMVIKYPFESFYLEETKAKNAENAYRNVTRDRTKNGFGQVFIKNGNAILSDVILDGIPIREYIKSAK